MKRYTSIREAARELEFPEFRLRQWAKTGRLPGFREGVKFFVDLPGTVEMLDRMSRIKDPEKEELGEDAT